MSNVAGSAPAASRVSSASIAAPRLVLGATSSANSLKTMVQREAIHVVGSVIQRGVSNQIVQTEKDRDAALGRLCRPR